MKNISRRKAIGAAGLAVGAFLSGRFSVSAVEATGSEKKVEGDAVVWKPVKLDPQKVAARAYELYPKGSCMYAAFTSICLSMGEATAQVNPALSKALLNFPCQMMQYGHSGMGGQGTLCGAINGACALFGLFIPERSKVDTLAAELCGYYETAKLPLFKPEKSTFEPMAQSVSHSVLCHISQTSWCKASGQSPFSDFRSERCKRLTADIAAKAVEILNRYVENEKTVFKTVNTAQKSCTDCHGKKGPAANISAKMNCLPCHDDLEEHYE